MTLIDKPIGRPVSRIDGRLKTTGRARYAADHRDGEERHFFAVIVKSRIAAGRILGFDLAKAERMEGFVRFLSHEDGPLLRRIEMPADGSFSPGEYLTPFLDAEVHFVGQHIGVVVASRLEVAEAAAAAIDIAYEVATATTALADAAALTEQPELYVTGEELQIRRGNVAAALADADVRLERRYTTPVEHHNPIEPSATLAVWRGDRLTLYDATQGSVIDRHYAAFAMDIAADRVRVQNPFIGGGFGCKGFTWPHTLIAAAAARVIGRPVLLALSRAQMYTSCGHRPKTVQTVTLGAKPTGELTAIRHETLSHRSMVGDHMEPCGVTSAMLYRCDNFEAVHANRLLNLPSGTPLRSPGEAPGTFALESALDELAHELGVDPLELRRVNHADHDPRNGRPWSSKHLLECYERAALKIAWSERSPVPGGCQSGNDLVGLGMATACYPAYRLPVQARLTLKADGRIAIASAVQDIGTGLYTIMAQMVAEQFGAAVEQIDVQIGDTDLPPGPLAGGSLTTASIAAGIADAAARMTARLTELLRDTGHQALASANERIAIDARGRLAAGTEAVALSDLFASAGIAQLVADGGSDIIQGFAGAADTGKTFYSFGAIFAEVRVDRDFGIVRVPRLVGVFDAGRVINAKTARSQLIGGLTFGVGMTLLEETHVDEKTGRIINANLGEYYVPVNADIHDIDVELLDIPDFDFSPFGTRGLGEIGNVGAAAAIANAVFNATGVRVRDLPIRLDPLLEGSVR